MRQQEVDLIDEEFLDDPERPGAHRARKSHTASTVVSVLIVAVVVLVVVLGVYQLFLKNTPGGKDEAGDEPPAVQTPFDSGTQPAEGAPETQPSAEPSAASPTATSGTGGAPAADRSAVVVLNASGKKGAAAELAKTLSGKGWQVANTGNAAVTPTSVVAYNAAGLKDQAEKLVEDLGFGTAKLVTKNKEALVVTVGKDAP